MRLKPYKEESMFFFWMLRFERHGTVVASTVVSFLERC